MALIFKDLFESDNKIMKSIYQLTMEELVVMQNKNNKVIQNLIQEKRDINFNLYLKENNSPLPEVNETSSL